MITMAPVQFRFSILLFFLSSFFVLCFFVFVCSSFSLSSVFTLLGSKLFAVIRLFLRSSHFLASPTSSSSSSSSFSSFFAVLRLHLLRPRLRLRLGLLLCLHVFFLRVLVNPPLPFLRVIAALRLHFFCVFPSGHPQSFFVIVGRSCPAGLLRSSSSSSLASSDFCSSSCSFVFFVFVILAIHPDTVP